MERSRAISASLTLPGKGRHRPGKRLSRSEPTAMSTSVEVKLPTNATIPAHLGLLPRVDLKRAELKPKPRPKEWLLSGQDGVL